MRYDAIVLAGGRSRRLDEVPKAGLLVVGRTLLAHTLAAAGQARHTVVVGPVPARGLPAGVLRAREEPPFGGPAAAVAAGLAALAAAHEERRPDWVLVLACDMPGVARAVPVLIAAASGDGAIAQDAAGRRQPLAAVYRHGALAGAVRERGGAGGLAGSSMFRLIRALAVTPVTVPVGATDDVDTWDDARRLGARRPERRPAQRTDDHSTTTGREHGMSDDREQDDRILAEWAAEVVAALQLQGLQVDVKSVLGLAGRAAHAVMRPAAPLTTFIAGYAAGRAAAGGADPETAVSEALAAAVRLCRQRSQTVAP